MISLALSFFSAFILTSIAALSMLSPARMAVVFFSQLPKFVMRESGSLTDWFTMLLVIKEI
nr:MAG TPA: hypothetical protein [Caudoviricetes sp.]